MWTRSTNLVMVLQHLRDDSDLRMVILDGNNPEVEKKEQQIVSNCTTSCSITTF